MGLQLTAEQVEERQAARLAQRRLVRLQAVTRQASACSVARTRRYRIRRETDRRAAEDAARCRAEAAAQALMAAAHAAAQTDVRARIIWHSQCRGPMTPTSAEQQVCTFRRIECHTAPL